LRLYVFSLFRVNSGETVKRVGYRAALRAIPLFARGEQVDRCPFRGFKLPGLEVDEGEIIEDCGCIRPRIMWKPGPDLQRAPIRVLGIREPPAIIKGCAKIRGGDEQFRALFVAQLAESGS